MEISCVVEFVESLGLGNRHLTDEFYYRLGSAIGSDIPYAMGASDPTVGTIVYMNSSAMKIGTSLWLNGSRLKFLKKFERFSFTKSTGLFNIGRVSPHSFGGVPNCMKGNNLFGAADEFLESLAETSRSLRAVILSSFTHLADVTPYVVSRDLPSIGDSLSCGCRVTHALRCGISDEVYSRERLVVKGRRLAGTLKKVFSDSRLTCVDLLANANNQTGALLYLSPRMVVSEVVVNAEKGIVRLDGTANASRYLAPITRNNSQAASDMAIEEGMISQTQSLRYVQVHAGSIQRTIG